MKLRKILFIFILFVVGIIGVNAKGPESDGYIGSGVEEYNRDTHENELKISKYFYTSSELSFDEKGMTYNSDTNTLILNNYTDPDFEKYDSEEYDFEFLRIYNMGDLNIEVHGTNKFLGGIILENTNLKIDGDGTLNFYGPGIFSTDSVKVEIKNITANVYGIENYYYLGCVASLAGNSELILDNVKTTYAIQHYSWAEQLSTPYYAGGEMTIKNSKLYGVASLYYLVAGKLNIENSELTMVGTGAILVFDDINIKSSKIVGNTMNLKKDSKLGKYFYPLPTEEEIDEFFKDREYSSENSIGIASMNGSMEIYNSTIKLDSGGIGVKNTLGITDSKIDIQGENIMSSKNLIMNSGSLVLKGYYPIKAEESFIINDGEIDISNSIQGITTNKIIINGGSIKSARMSDEMKAKWEQHADAWTLNRTEFYAIKANSFEYDKENIELYIDGELYRIKVDYTLKIGDIYEKTLKIYEDSIDVVDNLFDVYTIKFNDEETTFPILKSKRDELDNKIKNLTSYLVVFGNESASIIIDKKDYDTVKEIVDGITNLEEYTIDMNKIVNEIIEEDNLELPEEMDFGSMTSMIATNNHTKMDNLVSQLKEVYRQALPYLLAGDEDNDEMDALGEQANSIMTQIEQLGVDPDDIGEYLGTALEPYMKDSELESIINEYKLDEDGINEALAPYTPNGNSGRRMLGARAVINEQLYASTLFETRLKVQPTTPTNPQQPTENPQSSSETINNVPDTSTTDYHVIEIISIILIMLGISIRKVNE